MMRDPQLWREVGIRGGMMLIIAAICFFILRAGPWVWALPAITVAMVLAKGWARSGRDEENDA